MSLNANLARIARLRASVECSANYRATVVATFRHIWVLEVDLRIFLCPDNKTPSAICQFFVHRKTRLCRCPSIRADDRRSGHRKVRRSHAPLSRVLAPRSIFLHSDVPEAQDAPHVAIRHCITCTLEQKQSVNQRANWAFSMSALSVGGSAYGSTDIGKIVTAVFMDTHNTLVSALQRHVGFLRKSRR